MERPDWLHESPAPRLDLGGLTVRAWTPEDGPALLLAVLESLEQLGAWMPWATPDYGPQDAEGFIDHAVRAREAGHEFLYAVTLTGVGVVGSCGLHPRGDPGGLEIGYWIHTAHTGRGLATRAAAALVVLAMEPAEVTHVEIRHDRDNRASGRIPHHLGFDRVATREREPETARESGLEVVWRLTREAYVHGRGPLRAQADIGTPHSGAPSSTARH